MNEIFFYIRTCALTEIGFNAFPNTNDFKIIQEELKEVKASRGVTVQPQPLQVRYN